jgi:NAD-dependent dihydropyrimidine dehydrogenase PreA subunit
MLDPYVVAMAYVISSACVDVMHKSCVQECPVDCIYEGSRSMYINPDACVDCGACKLACEDGAIYYETDLPEAEHRHLADNAEFFAEVLPGRDAPLGSPEGAAALGPVGVDTPLVTAIDPRRNERPSEPGTFAPPAAFVDGGM